MTIHAWHTPAQAAGDYTCRLLRIPDELLPVVNGALLELVKDWNWQEYGTMTIDEATDLMMTMIEQSWQEGNVCMIGSVQAWAVDTLPANVLACDGAQYDRVDYPVLYDMLHSSLIVDVDTFNVPDLRGRAIIGTGTGSGLTARSFGDEVGTETHQLTETEIPSHTHSYFPPAINPDIEGPGIPDIGATVIGSTAPTGATGGDGSHQNMQPSSALIWGIVAR